MSRLYQVWKETAIFVAHPVSLSSPLLFTSGPLLEEGIKATVTRFFIVQRTRTRKLYFTRIVVQVQSKTCLTASPC